jgi:hypothetical protein
MASQPEGHLAFDWFTDFDWASDTGSCNLTQKEIKFSPEFNPDEEVNRTFENVFIIITVNPPVGNKEYRSFGRIWLLES